MIKSSTLSRAAAYSLDNSMGSMNENDSYAANKSRRQSAVTIGKKNFRLDDDDEETKDFLDGEPMNSSSVDLWRTTTTDTFGRSKSITPGNEFDVDPYRKSSVTTDATPNSHTKSSRKLKNGNIARTRSEQELLENIDVEDIPADIYVAHDGERNVMTLHGQDNDSDEDNFKPVPKRNLFDDSGISNQLSPSNSTNNFNDSSKKSLSKSPYLQQGSKTKASLLEQTQATSSSNFLQTLSDDKEETKHYQELSDQREREALKEQLEAMKKQNETLQIKISETQKESESLLQKERHEKMLLLQKIEVENKIVSQELIETRRKAELKLKKEKEELILIVKKMEKEKNELISQIHFSEEKYQNDTEKLTLEQQKYQEKLKQYEKDKMSLMNELEIIKLEIARYRKSNQPDDQLKLPELIKQQEDIEKKLQAIETDRNTMESSLNQSETVMLQKANEIEVELKKEKEELQAKLTKMEQEKNELSQHLLQTEQEAQAKISSLVNQLAQEKQAIEGN